MIEAGDIGGAVSRKPVKSEAAFRTISEVSEDLDVPQHVLRFWESKFPQIKPLKRGGGRRYYRPEDLHLLRTIRDLLYKDGYTIRGVQKLLRDQARNHAVGESKTDAQPAAPPAADAPSVEPVPEPPARQPEPSCEADSPDDHGDDVRSELARLLAELEELRALLAQARRPD